MNIGDFEVEATKVIRLQPDDILVFRVPAAITLEGQNRIREELTEKFGITNKILVLSSGADIEIIRREQAVYDCLPSKAETDES